MCNLNATTRKLIAIKDQIDQLNEEAKKLQAKIIKTMVSEDLKSFEVDDVKVTLVSSTKVTYDNSIVSLLETKAPETLIKTFDKDKLNACIELGKLNANDLKVYRKETNSTYLKMK